MPRHCHAEWLNICLYASTYYYLAGTMLVIVVRVYLPNCGTTLQTHFGFNEMTNYRN